MKSSSVLLCGVLLQGATVTAKSFQDTLANCTQQVLSQPTARSAVTVQGRWAVFATEVFACPAPLPVHCRPRTAAHSSRFASPFPQSIGYAHTDRAQDHADGKFSGLVDVFDALKKTWSTTQMSHSRTNMCSTTWRHLAIFAGGSDGRGMPKSKQVDIWDSTTGDWSTRQLHIGRDLL